VEVEGGGEKNGMEGIVVGIVNVGNGGTLIVGIVGMLVGSGGKVVGRDGIVGSGGTLP